MLPIAQRYAIATQMRYAMLIAQWPYLLASKPPHYRQPMSRPFASAPANEYHCNSHAALLLQNAMMEAMTPDELLIDCGHSLQTLMIYATL